MCAVDDNICCECARVEQSEIRLMMIAAMSLVSGGWITRFTTMLDVVSLFISIIKLCSDEREKYTYFFGVPPISMIIVNKKSHCVNVRQWFPKKTKSTTKILCVWHVCGLSEHRRKEQICETNDRRRCFSFFLVRFCASKKSSWKTKRENESHESVSRSEEKLQPFPFCFPIL